MLKIENLNVTFNAGTAMEKKALQNVNLTINDGDFVTIIGSNGAGKSTLLGSLFGTTKITSGKIILNDRDITNLPTYKRAKLIGILFQNPLLGTAPDMTIEENLVLASAKVKHKPFSLALTSKNRERLVEELKTLDIGLETRLKTNVGLLSGGQRQALTLLMATSATPQLLLLDEHTAALDPQTAIKIMDKTNTIVHEKKLTTMMITHNVQNAIDYGNKLLLMDGGHILKVIDEEEKKNLKVSDIMALYQNNLSDKMIL
ncbi:MAG: ATP-binding cassette domain-containing protein [Treponema sp.]|nr:ATP-binding cassette domain-containing protein [Candidatus Treponema equifaecale]